MPEHELEFINAVDHGGLSQSVPAPYTQHGGAPPQQQSGSMGLIRQAHHPVAAFFHYVFKTLAIFVYIFGGVVSSNFVLICVGTILLLAFDFWTVKNITGRLMVSSSLTCLLQLLYTSSKIVAAKTVTNLSKASL
jgi:Eukaryotic protein of unknown function (DUF846)